MTDPLHARVADVLRRRISDGKLAIGSSIPTEADLVEEFGASRGTVRQALSALRSEGLISGSQGRPPTVRARPLGQPFETFLSFTAWAELSGRKPGQRTIEISRRAPTADTALTLGLAESERVVDVVRLRLLDEQPTMLERSTFVDRVGRLLFDTDTDAGSIYQYLIGHGVDLGQADHTIDAIAADPLDAELLDVPLGSPLLRERRTVTGSDGSPVEYADDRYRPDRATFTISNAAGNGPRPGRQLEFRRLELPGDHDHD